MYYSSMYSRKPIEKRLVVFCYTESDRYSICEILILTSSPFYQTQPSKYSPVHFQLNLTVEPHQ